MHKPRLFAPLWVLLAIACGGYADDPTDVATINLSPDSVSVDATLTQHLTAFASNAKGVSVYSAVITWTSSDTHIATVSSTGIVKGENVGRTTITASSGGRTASAIVVVTAAPILSMTLTAANASLQLGASTQLTAATTDAQGIVATNRETQWESTNSLVVKVTATGLATAMNPGNATITATAGTISRTIDFNISGPVLFASISGGGAQTCGVATTGIAYCWGASPLGDGRSTDRGYPVSVNGSQPIAVVSAGYHHSCATTTGAVALCWGDNADGAIGTGVSNTPTTISYNAPANVVTDQSFTKIVAGGRHTCALTTGNIAYCWGLNVLGAIGDNTLSTKVLAPSAVAGGLAFASLAPGMNHTCGITLTGSAYCWGSASSGQRGDGAIDNISRVPLPVSGGLSFTQITSGFFFSCGLTAAGATYCWGSNDGGQLGNGSTTVSAVPVLVTGGLVFTSISANAVHVCGLTAAGAAYCWGSNGEGALGDGTLTSRTAPVAVGGGLVFTRIAAGAFHTCGLTAQGVAYCWGLNFNGQLGDGTFVDRTLPVRVVRE